MNKFKTLFFMQLKEKLDLSFLKSKKATLFKVVFSLLGFIVITAVAYLGLWLCQRLNLFSALNHIPLSFMAFLFSIIFGLNLITCTLGLSKTLYYAKDNQVLITFPVNPNTLFLSKMLVFYINEIKKTFTLLIPIFLSYGILSSLPIFYYIWMPIMLVIFSAIPVLLGGLLSIPTNYIIGFLKKFPIIKIILLVLILAGLVVGVVFLINMIPENINLIRSWTYVSISIRNFLNGFTKMFYPFYAFSIFLCGQYSNMKATLFTKYSWIVLLIMLGIIIVLTLINYFSSRPLYTKMVTKQFEFNKDEKVKEKPNKKYTSFISTCVYETKRNFRDTGVLSTSIASLIVAPIAILFLNTIYAAISTRLLGDYFTMAFNVLVIMLFVLAHNINVSSIYSRDGDALYLNKMKPNKPYQILVPRLFYNFAFTTLILIASSTVFFCYSSLNAMQCIFAFLMMWFVSIAQIIWCAEIDFLSPKSNIYKTEGGATTNPNEIKAMVLTFGLSAIVFGLTLFLLIDSTKHIWFKLSLVALALMLLRAFLFHIKTKTLFKEI